MPGIVINILSDFFYPLSNIGFYNLTLLRDQLRGKLSQIITTMLIEHAFCYDRA